MIIYFIHFHHFLFLHRGSEECGFVFELKDKNEGFTLVETLVSIVILSISLFSIAALVTGAVALQVTLKEKEEAMIKAASELKEIESLAIEEIQGGSRVIGKYTFQLSIDGEESTGGKIVGKTLRLRVSWAGVNGGKVLEIVRCVSSSGEQTRGKRLRGEQNQQQEQQQQGDTRPGHGYGDTNHEHTGPPGQQP